MSFRLKRSESPADGLRRIARELAEQALAEAAATDRDTPTRVHNARKCTKKMRSILRLTRLHLGETFRVENGLIRDAARRLSASRDEAVLLATFDALVREQSDELRGMTAPIRDMLAGKVSEAASASAKEQLALFADDMRELLERIDEWVVAAHGFDAVGDGLVRSYCDGRIAMKAALDTSDAANWHEWRKRVKDHWYHVRLLRNVWKPVMKARQQELGSLSDVLGEEHDLAVLHERIARLESVSAETSSCVLEAIERKRQHLQSSARPLGERIYAEKPKALGKRLDRYWSVWRSEM